MRAPSDRVLANLCNVYPLVPAQDKDLSLDGPNAFPAASATGLPCSYQCQSAERVDEAGRVSVVHVWSVLFATSALAAVSPPLKENDRLDLLAADGVTVLERVYVNGSFDFAGRSSATEVPCRSVF